MPVGTHLLMRPAEKHIPRKAGSQPAIIRIPDDFQDPAAGCDLLLPVFCAQRDICHGPDNVAAAFLLPDFPEKPKIGRGFRKQHFIPEIHRPNRILIHA